MTDDTNTPSLTASVVVLSYNQEKFVGDAVRAVLAQDCDPVEIIISDDCSTDGTFAAIKDAVDGYSGPHRVRVSQNEKNIGLVAHINAIFDIATGDVVIPAYGDDVSRPDRVAEIMQAFSETNPLLVHSDATAIDADGNDVPTDYRKADFFNTTDPLNVATSMALYLGASGAWHRDLFTRYGPLGFSNVYDDHVFGFRAALEGRITLIEKPLLHYREGIGLSHQLKASAPSATELSAKRTKILAQMVSVYRQRLKDAQTFGLDASHPVTRKLSSALQKAELRLACHSGIARMILSNLGRPGAALSAAAAEGLRMLRRK